MELDEKALAWLTGDRTTELAPFKEVQPLTGYIRGAVTALAGKRKYPIVDDTEELFDVISVSAGVPGDTRSSWGPRITWRPCMASREPSAEANSEADLCEPGATGVVNGKTRLESRTRSFQRVCVVGSPIPSRTEAEALVKVIARRMHRLEDLLGSQTGHCA
jgi:hypothetical protein